MSRPRHTLQLSQSKRSRIIQYLQQEEVVPRQVNRAQVLLCWDAGLTGAETARQLGMTEGRVYALRRAFQQQGLRHYLSVSAQGGAPTKLTPRVNKALGHLVTQLPRKAWSLRKIADYLVSKGLVASISTVTVAKALSSLEPAKAPAWRGSGQSLGQNPQ